MVRTYGYLVCRVTPLTHFDSSLFLVICSLAEDDSCHNVEQQNPASRPATRCADCSVTILEFRHARINSAFPSKLSATTWMSGSAAPIRSIRIGVYREYGL